MSGECRRACHADRESLIALWIQAFGDPREDIERFLDAFEFTKTAFVLLENERLCSMLFLLPTAVQEDNRRFSAGYIYAGATAADMRGNGCYRRLIDYVVQTARGEGTAALLLRPATDLLAESYRRMGFSVPLYGNVCKDIDIKQGDNTDAADYVARRRELLKGQAYVDWNECVFRYALSWCTAVADDTSLILHDGETAWERLPAMNPSEIALLMPLTEDFHTSAPIWFGYGLE